MSRISESSSATAQCLQALLRDMLDAAAAMPRGGAPLSTSLALRVMALRAALLDAPDEACVVPQPLVDRLLALLAPEGPCDATQRSCLAALTFCLSKVGARALQRQLVTTGVADALAALLRRYLAEPVNSGADFGHLLALAVDYFSAVPGGAELLLASPRGVDVPSTLVALLEQQAHTPAAPRGEAPSVSCHQRGFYLCALALLARVQGAVALRVATSPRALLAAAAYIDDFVAACEGGDTQLLGEAGSNWRAGLFGFLGRMPWAVARAALDASPVAPALAGSLCRAWAPCVGQREPSELEVDFAVAFVDSTPGCFSWLANSPACVAAVRGVLAPALPRALRSCNKYVRRGACDIINDVFMHGAHGHPAGPLQLTALMQQHGLAAALVSALDWAVGRSPGVVPNVVVAAGVCAHGNPGLGIEIAGLIASSSGALFALCRIMRLFGGGRLARETVHEWPELSDGRSTMRLGCSMLIECVAVNEPAAAAAAPGLMEAIARWLCCEAERCCQEGARMSYFGAFNKVACAALAMATNTGGDGATALLAAAPNLTRGLRAVVAAAGARNEAATIFIATRLLALLAPQRATPASEGPSGSSASAAAAEAAPASPASQRGPATAAPAAPAAAPAAAARCAHCRRTADAAAGVRLRVCSGCKTRRYCSEACGRAAWAAGHWAECKQLAAARAAAAAAPAASAAQ